VGRLCGFLHSADGKKNPTKNKWIKVRDVWIWTQPVTHWLLFTIIIVISNPSAWITLLYTAHCFTHAGIIAEGIISYYCHDRENSFKQWNSLSWNFISHVSQSRKKCSLKVWHFLCCQQSKAMSTGILKINVQKCFIYSSVWDGKDVFHVFERSPWLHLVVQKCSKTLILWNIILIQNSYFLLNVWYLTKVQKKSICLRLFT